MDQEWCLWSFGVPEGRVECKVKFDVADVAYSVVSLGKMIESCFTFSFDDHKCHMHKDNKSGRDLSQKVESSF